MHQTGKSTLQRGGNCCPQVMLEKQHPKHKSKRKLQHLKNPNVNKGRNNVLFSSHVDDPQEIYNYLRIMEKKKRPIDYLENVQGENTTWTRFMLVDWVVKVAEEYGLLPEILHLSVSYIDRLLSVNYETTPKLRLLGFSSLLIASKYEDYICRLHVDNFWDITFDKKEVVKMEADMLKSLNYEMGNPTVATFLRMFVDAGSMKQKSLNLKIENLSHYLAELSLMDYDCLRFLPSVVAASIVFLARFITCPVVHPWTTSLYECSGYKPVELKECVFMLHDLFLSRKGASFRAVREKYKQKKFKCVANLTPPPIVPNFYFKDM